MKSKLRLLITILLIGLPKFALPDNFITLDCKQFKNGGNDFFPIVMNYNVTIGRISLGNYWVSPRDGYHPDFSSSNTNPWGTDLSTNLNTIRAHFGIISSLGFNTIRLTGFSARNIDGAGVLTFWGLGGDDLSNSTVLNGVLDLIEDIIEAAEDNDLRVILLTGGDRCETLSTDYITYLTGLATRFASNTTLMAYDFYNEPDLEDGGTYSKSEISGFVNNWISAIKTNAPHLTTIGIHPAPQGIIEWDPTVYDIDFISYHIYPVSWSPNYNRYNIKLYWISQAIKLPWIIGETGFQASENCSADHIDGDYSDLPPFVEYSVNQTLNCGASGYSWWNFQDWKKSASTSECSEGDMYHGLIDKESGTINSNGIDVPGNYKINPSNLGFTDLGSQGYINGPNCCLPCTQPDNYFHPRNNTVNYNIKGRLLDENGVGIPNAFIRGWKGTYYRESFTKYDGTFDFKTDVPMSWVILEFYALKMVNTTRNAGYVGSYDYVIDIGDIVMNHAVSVNQPTLSPGSSASLNDYNPYVIQNATVTNGRSFTVKSSDYIMLKPGFKAYNGSSVRLYASKESCNTLPFKSTGVTTPGSEHKQNPVDIMLVPNPNNGVFTLKINNTDAENYNIEIRSLEGKLIYSKSFLNVEEVSIDLSNVSSGIYILSFIDNKRILSKKLVIN